MVPQVLLEASWEVFGGQVGSEKASRTMDEGGGRNGTKQVENVRPGTLRAQRDLVPENGYLGSENSEQPQLQRVF